MASGTILRPKPVAEYSTLINHIDITNGDTGTVYSRSISSFNVLFAEWRTNSNVRATAIFRVASFREAGYVELSYVDSANVQRWADIKYVNDTTVNLSASSNASGYMSLMGLTTI